MDPTTNPTVLARNPSLFSLTRRKWNFTENAATSQLISNTKGTSCCRRAGEAALNFLTFLLSERLLGKEPKCHHFIKYFINKISPKAKQPPCNNTPNPQPFPLHLRDGFKVKDEGRLSVPTHSELFSWVEVSLRAVRVWNLQGSWESWNGLGGREPLKLS